MNCIATICRRGNTDVITDDVAREIYVGLRMEGYIDKQGTLTDKYYEDKANGEIKLADEVSGSTESILGIIDTIYDGKAMQPENARSNNVELLVKQDKLAMPEFKALWNWARHLRLKNRNHITMRHKLL